MLLCAFGPQLPSCHRLPGDRLNRADRVQCTDPCDSDRSAVGHADAVVAEKIARLCDQPPTFRNPFEAVTVEQM